MSTYDFDAFVIGSGISGGWAAKELTEKGMKVLMMGRGLEWHSTYCARTWGRGKA